MHVGGDAPAEVEGEEKDGKEGEGVPQVADIEADADAQEKPVSYFI